MTIVPEIFEQSRIDPIQRPEQLSADDYAAVADCAANSRFLG
ncbi:MAG: hypothetical protein ACYSWW_13600 [Planctomycetota bacterium]